MHRPASGPPNPRHARYRQMSVNGSGCPVTILLIAICGIVAIFSQLGANTDKVAGWFFAAPPAEEVVTRLEYRLTRMEAAGEEDTPEYRELVEEYRKLDVLGERPFAQIAAGQVWRLVTPIFLHFGPLHLIGNMFWLWTLGIQLETALRRFRFGLLVVAIAVISNLAEAMIGGTRFGGMSGVVYGLFGFVVVHSKLSPTSTLSLHPQSVRFMLIWLVLCFTGIIGPIANWAHTFGLLSGAAIGAAVAMRNGGWKSHQRRREFRRASSSPAALHECAVCRKTEHHDPDLEFRVAPDGTEYCTAHLPEPAQPNS